MEKNTEEIQICHPSDLSDEIRNELASSREHFCIKGNRIFLQIDQSIFSLPNEPNAKKLVYSIDAKYEKQSLKPASYTEVIEKILKEPNYHPDPAILRAYGVRHNSKRCAAVLRAYSSLETDLRTVISSMAPLEHGDAVISIDYQTAVYIKELDHQSIEEMHEFFDALIGTLEFEGIVDIRAGIGCECDDLSDIRRSCNEGNDAIDTGIRFHKQDHIFVYSKQTLERIVSSIPEEKKELILSNFFGSKIENRLTEEMLETVRVFFHNDLNLTAASKQLYIHRNTLNYRLDKIRKDFGLDLRSFRDAVIFLVLTEIANEQ